MSSRAEVRIPPSRDAARPPRRIVPLACDEAVSLDPAPLREMAGRLGTPGAEAAAARALDEITALLARIGAPGALSRPAGLASDARAIDRLAREVGMPTLARAAAHLADAAGRLDPAALGATLARLERVGDRSIDAIWELRARR